MTDEQPAAVQVPTAQVSIPITPLLQQYLIAPGERDGEKIIFLVLIQPKASLIVEFDKHHALELADKLRAEFSGIEIARTIPPNGHKPEIGPIT